MKRQPLVLAIFGTILFGTAAFNIGLALQITGTVQIGKPFTLSCCGGHPQVATFQPAKMRLEFLRVKSDSRCPSDVNCFWAGSAAVELRVSSGKTAQTVTLNSGMEPRSAKVMGYKLKLVNLEPGRGKQQAAPPKLYQATLTLEKL
jgi:hypothetical protein